MDSFKKQLVFQAVIGFIIFIALAAGLIFFGGNIKDYSGRIRLARQDLLNRSLSLTSLASLRSQYNDKAKNYLAILNNIIPAHDQLITFNRDLQGAATGISGFGFSFVSETAPTADSLGIFNFVANINATLPQLLQFFSNLDKFKYVVTINGFSMERRDGSVFQVPVRGEVYFR